MKVSYDEVEKRVRIVEDIKYGSKPGQRKFFDIILLYKERAMYIVQIKLEGKGKVTRTCTKHRLRKPFKKAAVPKDAIFYQQQYMGTGAEPGAGLLLNVYGGKTKCKKGSYVMTVTKNWSMSHCPLRRPRVYPANLSGYIKNGCRLSNGEKDKPIGLIDLIPLNNVVNDDSMK